MKKILTALELDDVRAHPCIITIDHQASQFLEEFGHFIKHLFTHSFKISVIGVFIVT